MAIITETVRVVKCGGWRVSSGWVGDSGVATRGTGRSWGAKRKRSEGGGSVDAGDCNTGG